MSAEDLSMTRSRTGIAPARRGSGHSRRSLFAGSAAASGSQAPEVATALLLREIAYRVLPAVRGAIGRDVARSRIVPVPKGALDHLTTFTLTSAPTAAPSPSPIQGTVAAFRAANATFRRPGSNDLPGASAAASVSLASCRAFLCA